LTGESTSAAIICRVSENVRLRLCLVIALVAAVPAQLACGSSEKKPSREEQIREVEIQSLAAYACMPDSLRRELRQLEKQHDARVRKLAKAAQPKGTTGGTSPPVGFEQTVIARDKVRLRLLHRAQVIYKAYSPGGRNYDAGCFLPQREKARARIEGSS
jgi:hypothetical protein